MILTETLNRFWRASKKSSFGRLAFSLFIKVLVPYSGNLSPNILLMEGGKATIRVKDRRSLRNHLGSIHAIALANMGELASGLAMLSVMPSNTRGIVKSLNIEYLKKARGQITSYGHANPIVNITENMEQSVTAELFDADGDLVAKVQVLWQIGPNIKATPIT